MFGLSPEMLLNILTIASTIVALGGVVYAVKYTLKKTKEKKKRKEEQDEAQFKKSNEEYLEKFKEEHPNVEKTSDLPTQEQQTKNPKEGQ